jgi:hypothetical protein
VHGGEVDVATRKQPRVPRERNCDISGSGHSIPSGTRAMAPSGATGFDGQVRWIKSEQFSVTYSQTRHCWRHHNPERLKVILKDPGLLRIEVKPSYELLVIWLAGVKLPYRFYMSEGPLDDCSLGRNVWTLRARKLPDDYLPESE